MKSEFITHKGKKIYIANYTHLSPAEFEEEINAVTEVICREPKNSVLCLNNVTGLLASPQVIKLFTWSVGKTKPHILKVCVIGLGVSGARKTLLDAVLKATQQNVLVFEDEEKAKDWLALN